MSQGESELALAPILALLKASADREAAALDEARRWKVRFSNLLSAHQSQSGTVAGASSASASAPHDNGLSGVSNVTLDGLRSVSALSASLSPRTRVGTNENASASASASATTKDHKDNNNNTPPVISAPTALNHQHRHQKSHNKNTTTDDASQQHNAAIIKGSNATTIKQGAAAVNHNHNHEPPIHESDPIPLPSLPKSPTSRRNSHVRVSLDADEADSVLFDDTGHGSVGAAAASAVAMLGARAWLRPNSPSRPNSPRKDEDDSSDSNGSRDDDLTANHNHGSTTANHTTPTKARFRLLCSSQAASTSSFAVGNRSPQVRNGNDSDNSSRSITPVSSYEEIPKILSNPDNTFARRAAKSSLVNSQASPSASSPRSHKTLDASVVTRKDTNTLETSLGHTGYDLEHVLSLTWLSRPSRVLIVAKPSEDIMRAVERCAIHLLHKRITVYVEPKMHKRISASPVVTSFTNFSSLVLTWPVSPAATDDDESMYMPDPIPCDVSERLDLAVTLGGDGTVLWTSRLIGAAPCPPLVSFHLGSLGFLAPFDPKEMETTLDGILCGGFNLFLRHRLLCRLVRAGENVVREKAVMNEVVIDRGPSPFLTNLQCFVGDAFMTSVQGDGVLISTPTGSTAYNLAAGGSMVHPAVPGIMFTPICPHSLSFRPLVLPDTLTLKIMVPDGARGDAFVSFDGKERERLGPGDQLYIRVSPHPIPSVCVKDGTRDWFLNVRNVLKWNDRDSQQLMSNPI